MGVVGKTINLIFAIPIFITVSGAAFLGLILNSLSPKRLKELIPFIEMNTTLLTQISLMFSDPNRLEAEKALKELENVGDQVDEVVKGYAMRKGVGQSVDTGLSAIALAATGLGATFARSKYAALYFYLFGSATMALSTFAGLFGPPYGLFQETKNYNLRHGNYRGAGIFKQLEAIFALPFLSSAAGFLLLDMPPVDQESLVDFKEEMGKSLEEAQDKLTSLLGSDKSGVSRRSKKMIAELMSKNEDTLAALDFRNLRQDKAREFALEYYQKEFSLVPWRRKRAAKEFAEMHNFTLEEAENTLKLISFKITAGQEDEDLVNNVMVTGALKGMIMLERNYMETYEDLELGQISTGLAFGARQFLKDHYNVQSKKERWGNSIKFTIMSIYSTLFVFLKAFVIYCTDFFDFWIRFFVDHRGENVFHTLKARFAEVRMSLYLMGEKIKNIVSRKKSNETDEMSEAHPTEDGEEIQPSRKLNISRILQKTGRAIIEFIVLPFKVIGKLSRWTYLKLKGESIDIRNKMAAELGHAALVSMYNELYLRLVQQTHVSSAF